MCARLSMGAPEGKIGLGRGATWLEWSGGVEARPGGAANALRIRDHPETERARIESLYLTLALLPLYTVSQLQCARRPKVPHSQAAPCSMPSWGREKW